MKRKKVFNKNPIILLIGIIGFICPILLTIFGICIIYFSFGLKESEIWIKIMECFVGGTFVFLGVMSILTSIYTAITNSKNRRE